MSVSRILLLLAAAGCHCARNILPGLNEVRFENKNKELIRTKNALVQARLDGGGSSRMGVLSPRPDVIGPRDVAHLTAAPARPAAPSIVPGARRIYESELDAAAEYYDAAIRLWSTDEPSSPNVAMRYNPYMRGRSMRSTTTRSTTHSTMSTTRSLTTPRTQSRTLPSALHGFASQNLLYFKSKPLVGYDDPLVGDETPPQELDLPLFGDDPADLAGIADAVGPVDKYNLSKATADTHNRVTPGSVPSFRLDSATRRPTASEAPKKQRFENFVKFIQANKDLVEEYIKKKRWAYKASSRGGRAQGGPAGFLRWSLDPFSHGMPHPPAAGSTLRPPLSIWTDTTTQTPPPSPPYTTHTNLVSRQGIKEYSTTGDPRLLDLAPARGGSINSMRVRGRICQRHVLLPEGPKYNKKGAVYLAAFQSIYDKDFPQTRAPRLVLPICCNCCRKSVLGCE